ncbi:hypothetical protein [Algiphilus sp.]|uniref:hypothetical protein n=1 Tax=Algiphilus sp. TaxID=1872431 RepID=UPI003B52611B
MKMKTFRLSAAFAICMSLSACSTNPITLRASESLNTEGNAVFYNQGVATLASQRENSVVRIAPLNSDDKDLIQIIVAISNASDRIIEVSELDVMAIGQGDGMSSEIDVLTFKEFQEYQKDKASPDGFMMLAMVLNAAAAGYGTATGLPTSTAQANMMTLAQQEQTQTLGAQKTIEDYRSQMLQRTTVLPGQEVGGMVVMRRVTKNISKYVVKPESLIKIAVNVGPDRHEFTFYADEI